MITPTAVSLPPAIIDRPNDDGTSNTKLNFSDPSTIVSLITCTLTLLIVISLSNVAVSLVVLKSTSPVSQTLFTQNIVNYTHNTLLPSAGVGDCSDGITNTSNGLLDVPPGN